MKTDLQLGYKWAIESLLLLKKKPSKWVFLALAYVFLFLVLPAFPATPFILRFAIIISWPMFLVIAMGLLREVDFDRATSLGDVIQQAQSEYLKLLGLGLVCLVYGVLVSVFTKGDALVLEVLMKPGANIADLTQVLPILLKYLLLLTPILMASWFAPPLIAFQNATVIHAIKSSIAGCLQYVVALSVAWLVLTGFMMVGMLMLGMLIGIISVALNMQSKELMALTAFACLLLGTSWMLAFQYICYRDVFDPTPVGGGEIAL